MRHVKGATLIELLVVLVIGGLVVYSAGAVTNIAKQSNSKIGKSSTIYSDISYGFKLFQRRVHESHAVLINSSLGSTTNSWLNGEKLNVDSHAFGVYKHSGSTRRDFVYQPDKGLDNVRETIFSVIGSDLLNAVYNVDYSLNQTRVNVNVYGVKSDIPFNMTTTVKTRR